MDAVERFAAAVAAFRDWARGTDTGEAAVRAALLHITRLYLAALELPAVRWDEVVNQPEADRVNDTEWRAVYDATARLPLDYYGSVFYPLIVPPEESPSIGSVSDDIADLYRDTVSGLRALEAGLRAVAVWDWKFHFRHHWGKHATDAIGALHAWLAENASE